MGILIALLVLILLIILFLSIPFNLLFYLRIQEDFIFQMKLYWFFGLAHFNIAPGKKKESKKEPDRKIKREKQRKPVSFDLMLKVIGTKGLPRQFIRLIKDVFHSITIKSLSFDLKIGLEDPTDNAYVYACVVPVSFFLRRTPYQINIQPVFENELVFDCVSTCNIRIFPIKLVGCFFKIFFSAPFLKTGWMVIKDRWTIKK